ncbi:MAG: hypothetical protein H6830_06275 [Planctomycetes bacterium]|mgnify:CR=1 FL=1|nr:hypothetical protein [Planctomycetota bacterium]MCB9909128.1 hypothetical protein [Planctomycetota bacterium]MCB9911622.1 hypothetical protein [Planctomycetota bacterium]HPF13701.1 hypothetical protein [Planctomycetota bacterium]
MQSTLFALLLLALLSSCGVTCFGKTFHQESQSTRADLGEVTVVEVLPLGHAELPSVGAASQGDLRFDWSGDLGALQEGVPAFVPRTELVLDLGVGEVPFDDGAGEYQLDYRPVRGFSDALVQLELRARSGPGFAWYGIAAINRVQEETLLETVDQGDWAWFGVGVQYSW